MTVIYWCPFCREVIASSVGLVCERPICDRCGGRTVEVSRNFLRCAGPASGRVQQGERRHFVGVDWGDDGYGAYVAGHQEGDLFVIDEAETFRSELARSPLLQAALSLRWP